MIAVFFNVKLHLQISYTAMEQMRQPAASKLGVTPLEISLPYDLVSLMPLDVLWTRIAHKIDIMTREVI